MNGTDDDLGEPEPDPGVGFTRRVRRPRRRGRITAVILAVVLVPLIALGSAVGWFFYELDGHGSPGALVEVKLQPGWGVPRIARELQHDHIIGSSFAFNVYSRLNGDNSFQAGTYEMHTNLGVKAAVRALKAGPKIDYLVLRIPPGLWLEQIADRVGKLGGRSAQRFLQDTHNNAVRSLFEPEKVSNLEGLVRPDTYNVSNSQDEIAILQTMVTAFDTRAKKLGLLASNYQGRSAYEVVIIASLIEAEAKVPQDRPLIASVIYNRLAANMTLGIDSTIIYGRGNPADRGLSQSDLDRPGPYNSYLNVGLPPTPIGSVSDASLRAALAPAQTSYLYFVLAGKDGHHAFATTPEEHQRNVDEAKRLGLL